jgi:hypothetical protein
MITRNGALTALAAVAACTAAAPATATAVPTKVKVRVEGKAKTILERTVTTDVHAIDGGDGSGPHKCDGTNGGAGTVPGPTATSAMDDAIHAVGRTWAGEYNASFDDFIVNRIGPLSSSSTQFWGVAVQGRSLEVGGCQKVVSAGQEVLWAYDSFGKKLLHASAAKKVRVGKVLSVRVVDTDKGNAPVKGATIGGVKTSAKGVAKLRFKHTGTRRFKARAPKAIRSNQITVKVLKRK